MLRPSRLIASFTALAFSTVSILPAFSQATTDDGSSRWDYVIPKDFFPKFSDVLSLPLNSPEFASISGPLQAIMQFGRDEENAHKTDSTRPSSAEVAKKLPELMKLAQELSKVTHAFNLRVQAGDLKGLVDPKAWAECAGVPDEALKTILSLPQGPNGELQIPNDKIKEYKEKIQGIESKKFDTCKNLVNSLRTKLEKASIDAQKQVDDFTKQIDDLNAKANKTQEDLDKLKQLQNQNGQAQDQHDKAEEGKKGLESWQIVVGVLSIVAGVILCIFDDPVDGVQLIAGGLALLTGGGGGGGKEGEGKGSASTDGNGGGAKTDAGKALQNASKDGKVKPEDLASLQSKFGGTPVDAAQANGTVVLLFNKTAGTLTVANSLDLKAPLFVIKLADVELSASWQAQSFPLLNTLSDAHKWSYTITNGFVDLYLVGSFGDKVLDVALVESISGKFVAVNDAPPTDAK